MHEQQRALDARVGEVGEESAELGCGEHALVNDRARRERGEVHLGITPAVLVFHPFASDIRAAIEMNARLSPW